MLVEIPVISTVGAIAHSFLAMMLAAFAVRQRILLGFVKPGSSDDPNDIALLCAQRAHGNHVEYAPFFLILSVLAETQGANEKVLVGLHALFLFARLYMAASLIRNKNRIVGFVSTMLSLNGMASLAVFVLLRRWAAFIFALGGAVAICVGFVMLVFSIIPLVSSAPKRTSRNAD